MNNYKILVVDDEEDLCEILQFNLENEGYHVDVAHSGEEALTKVDESYHLLLLDVMMESMSGFKVAERIRKVNKSAVPIVFLTARDTENDMLTGFSLGADDYISKPFSIKEVLARVKAVINRSQLKAKVETSTDILVRGNLKIDRLSKSIHIDDELLNLTKKEFEIVTMLAEQPGRVFSRAEILHRAWSDEEFVLERTVDVHITRLRKKLGEYGKYIANRSGYGYCLELK